MNNRVRSLIALLLITLVLFSTSCEISLVKDAGTTPAGTSDTSGTTVPTPEDPTDDDEGRPTDGNDPNAGNIENDKGLSGGAIADIVIGSVAVVGIVGFSLLWFVIKKKRFSQSS